MIKRVKDVAWGVESVQCMLGFILSTFKSKQLTEWESGMGRDEKTLQALKKQLEEL